MSGAVARARQRMPQTGDYLDKDELVRNQEPMGIANVAFDQTGHSFGPRWVLTVAPWFDDQEGPSGLLTFGANPTRNPMFEDFQAQIEENGNDPIGPIVVIKEKSQKGYRFYTLADWQDPSEAPAAAEAVRAPRPQRSPAPAESAPVEVPPAAVVKDDEPVKRRPGRPRKAEATNTASGATNPTTNTASGATNATTNATNGNGTVKPAPQPAPSLAATSVNLSVGEAVCPDCNQTVRGRVLPDDAGNRFIIHPHCPATGRAGVVPVLTEVGAEA